MSTKSSYRAILDLDGMISTKNLMKNILYTKMRYICIDCNREVTHRAGVNEWEFEKFLDEHANCIIKAECPTCGRELRRNESICPGCNMKIRDYFPAI